MQTEWKAGDLASAASQANLGKRWLESLRDQFRRPAGLIGRLVGWWMNLDNASMNETAVKLLDVGQQDSVLELGFGSGQAIGLLIQKTAAPAIAGVDPSVVMLEQARTRNEKAIGAGRVRLLQASVEELPFADNEFSKVFAVSNFHDWTSCRRGLAQVHRVLKRGGLLLICLRRAPRRPGLLKKPGITPNELAADIDLLRSAGFTEVQSIDRNIGQGLVCLLART
jgi:SAM-dependent methyltransferase